MGSHSILRCIRLCLTVVDNFFHEQANEIDVIRRLTCSWAFGIPLPNPHFYLSTELEGSSCSEKEFSSNFSSQNFNFVIGARLRVFDTVKT